MRRVWEAIIVEGRYDKNALSQIVDAVIIETGGFHIFSDKENLALIRRMQQARGVILLTDGDSAGFLIRNHLKGALGAGVKQAYIPDRYGKERRKRKASSEGKLGVEGMPPQVLLHALEQAGATFEDAAAAERQAAQQMLTKADLYALGLSGGQDSREKRSAVLRALRLPERLGANALLDVLNALYGREAFLQLLQKLEPTLPG